MATSTNSSSLQGKKILVTGAGRGIGYDLVLTLLEHGAIVYGLTKSKEKLDKLVADFSGTGRLHPLHVDLADWDAVENALEPVEPLDGLVNNAGVAIEQDFLNVTKEAFDTLFNVNVRGLVCATQIIARKMVANKVAGSIVNISSVSASCPSSSLLIYGTTKAAVDRLTKGMAFELGPRGIRINSVNPTIVLTDMGIQLWSDEEKAARVRNILPLRKFAQPKDVVQAILFLLDNDKSGMVTGQCLAVDGGQLTFGVVTNA